MATIDPDHRLRVAAKSACTRTEPALDDLVPTAALREGFVFDGERISFGSLFKSIHRPRQMRSPAALTLVTAARVRGKRPAYEDEVDIANRAIVDRDFMGIDPAGVVHIAKRLRDEQDGPMLREGLQGFHGRSISVPHRREERPEPDRIEQRFDVCTRIGEAA